MRISELIDMDAERTRIAKELEHTEKGLHATEQKLSNEKFVQKAPEQVVEAERTKAEKYRALIAQLKESAAALGLEL